MRTITLGVSSRTETNRRLLRAFEGVDVGILQKTADGRIEFPFDAVRVNFMLKAA